MNIAILALLLPGASCLVAPMARSRRDPALRTATLEQSEVYIQGKVVEPKRPSDVAAAAGLLTEKFGDAFGVVYRTDTGYASAQLDAPVLDLSGLTRITVSDDEGSVMLGGGVTVKNFVDWLSGTPYAEDAGLLAALPAVEKLPLLEAALDAANVELRAAVKELRVVRKDGGTYATPLDKFDEEQEIVTGISLKAPGLTPADMLKGTAPATVFGRYYTRRVDAPAVEALPDLPESATVMIFKYGTFGIGTAVAVRVDGPEPALNLPADEWHETVAMSAVEFWQKRNELSRTACFDQLTASAVLDGPAPELSVVLGAFPAREEHLLVEISGGKLTAFYDADEPPHVDADTLALFHEEKLKPHGIAPEAREKTLLSGFKSLDCTGIQGTQIPGFKGEVYDVASPGYANKRYQYATSSYDSQMHPAIIAYPVDEEDVSAAIKYATLPEFAEARKTVARPSGYPLKVMGRGGGHQYCGVSCDNDALILSMDRFTKTEFQVLDEPITVTGPDGAPHEVKKVVELGTGLRLKKIAKFNNRVGGGRAKGVNEFLGVTIPHGECPMVGIGGHAQTGGYGHIVRNFGLAIDYVYGFTIVLADGSIRHPARDSTDPVDRDLYWAVLGGSPGAFGVTTNLVIHPLCDEDWPHSTGFDARFPYNKESMGAALKILEDFINRAQEDDENALAEGLDLMMSLGTHLTNRLSFKSGKKTIWKKLDPTEDAVISLPSTAFFEMECRDMTDAKAYGQFKEIKQRFYDEVTPHLGPFGWSKLNPFAEIGAKGKNNGQLDGESHYKLSEMSLHYTRKPPGVTSDGRENWRPYNKACYGSVDQLKPGWAEAYGDLLDDVVKEDDIHCIFQVVVGGGAQTRNGKAGLNSVAHRDAHLHGLVFDLFRVEEEKAIKTACDYQRRFEMDIVNKYQTAYPKVMAQWASHGDLDLSKPEVWEKYFDKPEVYHRLRDIKKRVDPGDVFKSRFTLPPAE